MMNIIAGVIGFFFGIGAADQYAGSKIQRKLQEFADAHGMRLLDRDGNEIPLADLAAKLK